MADKTDWTWAVIDLHGSVYDTYGWTHTDYEQALHDANWNYAETGMPYQVRVISNNEEER